MVKTVEELRDPSEDDRTDEICETLRLSPPEPVKRPRRSKKKWPTMLGLVRLEGRPMSPLWM